MRAKNDQYSEGAGRVPENDPLLAALVKHHPVHVDVVDETDRKARRSPVIHVSLPQLECFLLLDVVDGA